MEINDKLIDKLADLCKLEFSENEKTELSADLSNILDLIEKLKELPTDNVEPLIYVNDDLNQFREDSAKNEITREQALKNAPSKDSDYIKVPKFINK
ncbi:MAG: Asp-tRNA(Asn)/Glu-tRNA(Gln) amidotransferase subunit GatC [Chitinophagaceae bacterium]|nr:MAG: Asp-tRNA(Asn)/Glu-tRNA(Gln) amidotransferase subunit GatC [Chitinophagaceae bacterium]